MKKIICMSTALFAIGLAVPTDALAQSFGWVEGRLRFYQNQGNYCPNISEPSRDCTNAVHYTESEYQTVQPVRNAKVFLYDQDNRAIGFGTTDLTGYFLMQWTSWTPVTEAQVRWYLEHKDGRFVVRTGSGGAINAHSGDLSVTPGTMSSNPQWLGTFTFGSRSSPVGSINVYDGAERMWRFALSNSNRMHSYFSNVEIRAFNSVCRTSCAIGSSKLIHLDPNAAFAPQARIMHEMGHIASYLSHSGQSFRHLARYCYPSDSSSSSCGWGMTTPEWATSQFEEGYATFLGTRAIYGQQNTTPYACLSNSHCVSNPIEVSDGNYSNCSAGENRWPRSVTRFLWDIYDSNADYSTETITRNYYTFFDTLASYGSGDGNREKNEPWDGGWWWSVDDLNGRSGVDFRVNYQNLYGVNVFQPWENNCRPLGD